MMKNTITLLGLAAVSAVVPFARPAWAQGEPVTQLFQINSGIYTECCGIAGEVTSALPTPSQSYLQLVFSEPSGPVTLTVLGDDQQTIHSIVPCPVGPPILFQFQGGLVFPDRYIFHVDPARAYWNYTVSNSASGLRMDGILGTVNGFCADAFVRFSHSNVLATVLPPPPRLEQIKRDDGRISFQIVGEPAFDYFVEYNETWRGATWHSLTNFRAKLETITAVVTDPLTNGPTRFYRVRKQDCQCD
jgi:hypothetical protein